VQLRPFMQAGHPRSLVAALVHFDVSFMTWVLLGALGAYVGEDLGLSASEKGLLVALPLLSAAGCRILLGILADRFGPKRVGTVSMALTLLPLGWGWLGAGGYGELLAVGLLLGIAGASFAISLPLASRWYPPRYQGLAMGIAGAGNSGTVVTTLLAPRIAEQLGWQAVLGIAMVPVSLALATFVMLAKDPPAARPVDAARPSLTRVLREADSWRLCGLYAVTFGGFVGLASFLPTFFVDQYDLAKVDAGALTAAGAALGSLLRPVGGHLGDRLGGTVVLTGVYLTVAVLFLALAGLPPVGMAAVGFPAAMAMLGVGNGAVFQLVGLRYGERIGVVTGLVGAAGGLGGFFLPTLLGFAKDLAGSYGVGLAVLSGAAAAALVGTLMLRGLWRASWGNLAEARP